MIEPDLVRVVQPLGSFGFYADNDGLIYSVSGPFEDRQSSPAWKAGIRPGARLDLQPLKCRLSDIADCSPALTVLGGVEFVLPGRTVTFDLAHGDQPWPTALIAQNIAACFAEGAAYAGFLLFVLRVPNNTTEPRWRPLERALPLIGFFFSVLLLASYVNLFGYRSEGITRTTILAGFAIDLLALGILLARRHTQAPEDYQRVRWVIWGLPHRASNHPPGRTRIRNGHLKSTLVLELPDWAWLALGAVAVFLISRLPEREVHAMDRYFNRELYAAETRLIAAIKSAKKMTEIDRLLTDDASDALALASGAAFRKRGTSYFRDENGKGWDECATRTLKSDESLLAPLAQGKPFDIPNENDDGLDLPQGLARPIFGVPAVNPVRCFAVSLYGPHGSGTDLDKDERAMLDRLARDAAAMYAELESIELGRKVAALEGELERAQSKLQEERSPHGNL
jgi:hypothetical protein